MHKTLPCFLAVIGAATLILHAEEAPPKFALVVRWTPPGGEVMETKVPEFDFFTHGSIQIPVARGVTDRDPAWNLKLSFDSEGSTVHATLNDHSRMEPDKEFSFRPIEILDAAFALTWNQEVVLFDSPHGKLSFVPGLQGSLPAIAERIEFSYKVTQPGRLSFKVYNPTEFKVAYALIRVTISPFEGRAAFDRVYKILVNWDEFDDGEGEIIIPKLQEYPEGTPIEVKLERILSYHGS